jgi:hypothetical protein
VEKITACVESAIAQTLLHTLVSRWREAIVCLQRGTRQFLLKLAASNKEIVEIWEKKDKKQRYSSKLKYLLAGIYRRYLRRAARTQTQALASSFQSHASAQFLRQKTAMELIGSRVDAPQVGSMLIMRQNFFKFSEHQVAEMIKKCRKWVEGGDLGELVEEEVEEMEREVEKDERGRSTLETEKYGRGRKAKRPKHAAKNCT